MGDDCINMIGKDGLVALILTTDCERNQGMKLPIDCTPPETHMVHSFTNYYRTPLEGRF
jgi:hypothetical protein